MENGCLNRHLNSWVFNTFPYPIIHEDCSNILLFPNKLQEKRTVSAFQRQSCRNTVARSSWPWNDIGCGCHAAITVTHSGTSLFSLVSQAPPSAEKLEDHLGIVMIQMSVSPLLQQYQNLNKWAESPGELLQTTHSGLLGFIKISDFSSFYQFWSSRLQVIPF